MKNFESNSVEPAFPIVQSNSVEGNHVMDCKAAGLTKREYFAAMAMQGMLSRDGWMDDLKILGENSVRYADAVLSELEKPQP